MNANVGSVFYGKSGEMYTLEKKIGSGGEGTVFKVSGKPLAAKIYKKIVCNIEQKILYMIDHRVNDLYDQARNPVMKLVWPVDALYAGNMFIGYVMPLSQGGIEIFHIARGNDPYDSILMTAFPNYTRLHNVVTARNLAAAIAHIHAHGYVVGDMNCKNILIGEKCQIIILDNDSFDFTDKISKIHYKCEAATCEYLAPELHGINLRSQYAIFSKESDNFSLAIHIFQLLMNNFHPFTGKNEAKNENSSSENQQQTDIQHGNCPFVRDIPGLSIPVAAPYLREMVTPALIQDFQNTFVYDFTRLNQLKSQRTSAEQWRKDLDDFLQYYTSNGKITCPNCSTHVYPSIVGTCGICEAKKRFQTYVNGPRPVPPPMPPKPPKTQTHSAPPESHFLRNCVIAAIILALLYFLLMPSDSNSGQDHKNNSSYDYDSSSSYDYDSSSSYDYDSSSSYDYDSSTYSDFPDFQEQGEYLSGNWASSSIPLDQCNVYPFILDSEAKNCTKLDIQFGVEMNYNTHCEWWTVWLKTSRGWEASGSLYLPDGDGYTFDTIELSTPMSFTQAAITPQIDGNYSFTYRMALMGYYD